jgi:hypothetical protein
MMRNSGVSQIVAVILAASLGTAVFVILLWSTGVRPGIREDFSQIDIITVVLASLGVIVAILTFFLAILAFYGWAAFRTIVDERFDDSVRKKFDPSNQEYANLLERFLEDAKSLEATKQQETPEFSPSDTKLNDELK